MVTATESMHCIGIVLAGGLSTRMGRDKALLSWQGRPLIERQLAILQDAGVDKVLVSGYRPDYQGIADAQPFAGPLGGLNSVAAVHSDNDTHLLVIPVDMPLLQAALLQRLATTLSPSRCLRFAGHVLPMRLRLDAQSRAQLTTLMSSDDSRRRSLRALQQAVGVEELDLRPDETVQLTDCNTEAVWNEVAG